MKKFAPIIVVIIVAAAAFYFGVRSRDNATTTAGATPTVSASASSTPTSAPTVVAGSTCTSAELTLAIEPDNGAAGTAYYSLVLTNSGQTSCTVYGYPGVSLVDGAGAQIGAAAARSANRALVTVTLAPGAAAHSSVGFPNPGNFPGGSCTANSVSLKVYPPNETHALTVPLTQQACAGFSVNPLAAGTHD